MRSIFFVLTLLAFYLNSNAAIKAGDVSMDANSTTTISLASAYQSTLKQARISNYLWSTSSTNITITSQNAYSCTVKSKSAGKAQVNYYCSYWIGNNYRTMDFYYTITVNNAASITISPSSISFSNIGETATVKATQPGYVGGVYFTSSDENVAKVGSGSSSGYTTTATVTAKGAGTAYIYAHSAAGVKSDACKVTVSVPKKNQSLVGLSSPIDLTYGISARTLPSSTDQNLALTWSSNDNTVATISSNKLNIKGAGTCNIRATNSGNSSYYAFSESYKLVVNKASLTIKANNCTRYFGVENPELTVSYNGFVNNENESVLIKNPIVSTTATIESPVGEYPITVSGASAKNYVIDYVPGVLTVEEDPTGMVQITSNEKKGNEISKANQLYDLQGRKVNKVSKGIYISKGKTVVIN
jgi:uncharacterized protein YjdB